MGEKLEKEVDRGVFQFVAIMVVFFVLVGAIVVSVKKDESAKEAAYKEQAMLVMKDIGGDLETVPLGTYEGTVALGEVSRSFFSFNGVFEGKSVTMVRFSWKSREGIAYITEMPVSRLQRVGSSDGDQVSVNFNLELPDSWSEFNDNKSGGDQVQLKELTPNQVIERYSRSVSFIMNDKQYSEFLKNINS